MGTTSLIYFQEKRADGTIVIYVIVYQHFDGYLSGVGRNLATFLTAVKMVNGFDMVSEANYNEGDIICNGFGDLAAQYIKKYEKENPRICETSCVGDREEFTYYVTYNTTSGCLTVKLDGFDVEMSPKQFEQLCNICY